MKYEHRFCVRAPLDAVAEFHTRSDSMARISPPLIRIKMEQAPPRLRTGDRVVFKMWLGPLPVRWRAFITQVSPTGFTDHQLAGPFRYWVHRHWFTVVDEQTTEVVDQVRAGLRWHPLWWPVGLVLWAGLPLLFAYRGWKTRRIVEHE